MKKRMFGRLALVILLAAVATAFYFWRQNLTPEPKVLYPSEAIPAPPPAVQAEPAIRYPIKENENSLAEKPLPALNESDPDLWDALHGLLGRQTLKELFRSENIVRNIVVTIDNLPRQIAAARLLPTEPAKDMFLAARKGEGLFIAQENAARYRPYVRVAEMVDAERLVAVYVRFYPLFQRAYQDLGYPKGYFNDRLVAVIDHMLAAPEVEGPVALVQPHVLYRFADPALESASAGHKIMIRMGSENAARVKVKLREIRRQLTGEALQQSTSHG